jgi:hypothetical protein
LLYYNYYNHFNFEKKDDEKRIIVVKKMEKYWIFSANFVLVADEFSDPGVTSLGLLSDLQSAEMAGNLSGADTLDHSLDHTLSIDELWPAHDAKITRGSKLLPLSPRPKIVVLVFALEGERECEKGWTGLQAHLSFHTLVLCLVLGLDTLGLFQQSGVRFTKV